MTSLDDIRAELERLDRALVALIGERVRMAQRAATVKRRAGLPVLDPAQEAAVVRRAAEWARTVGLPAEDVRDVFWGLVGLTRRAQRDAAGGDR
jgi:chorismate mutase